MKERMRTISLILIGAFVLGVPALFAANLEEGMTQGDFALWLVKQVGALSKLPPAAQGQDAINFLVTLGVAPESGWSKDEPVSADLLRSILGEEEDLGGLSFDDLVGKLKDTVQRILGSRQLGVFRATSSASGSTPAA